MEAVIAFHRVLLSLYFVLFGIKHHSGSAISEDVSQCRICGRCFGSVLDQELLLAQEVLQRSEEVMIRRQVRTVRRMI
ncbi:hypothetical protein KIN20_014118 [Parelaphostrongylus tenuis]|uniref:Secreted protein n=1 Tax=Parelaphostrongylus tenuis TaxID=148309 RepID=A0AAD5MGM3_PARTN|nr:hypothetical protein KIN20_014118 [Parelaphostrongylus tenuis]